ncbi:hypothetical protein A1O7_00253 [Cladophialophora yegresii CBS 114405]|uniref:Heterokaryon incompatibility domain-containing protein n=1 Tax=Cladophialophora yegresii CBS 114405 TaxID=1182544 RepID=W9W7I7_9EURO|nr:uncharacterized protein A1O7_00253 [Cladophialophora yegresii CBS 114405]EXJ63918.1 hypothetical protein A1O7_00253 [Cladophialophora yegresii CBS 114405]
MKDFVDSLIVSPYHRGDLWGNFKPHIIIGSYPPDLYTSRSKSGVALLERDRLEEAAIFHFNEDSGLILPLYPPDNSQCSQGRRIQTQGIDFGLVRNWIEQCRREHPSCCSSRPSRETRPHYLLDCNTRTIVQDRGDMDYVALSYLWGSSSATFNTRVKHHVGESLGPLPQTIEDAIIVTKHVNMRYLWVDRLCLPQDETTDFYNDLRSMAVLYESAELVIIAAAGDGADYGLPGVQARHRLEQCCIQIGGHDYIVFDTPLRLALEESRYITRGWTYQEEVSSARRLYFTDHQVYFECRASQSCEFVVNADTLPRFMKGRRNDNPKADPTDIDTMNTAWRHIKAVSERALTYESDALNAVLGLLERPEAPDTTPRVRHLYGIPLPQDHVTERFTEQLSWRVLGSRRRLHDFPSWSWAGWAGRGYMFEPSVSPPATGPTTSEVMLEDQTGRLTPLIDVSLMRGNDLLSVMPQILHITAQVCEFQWSGLRAASKPDGVLVTMPGKDGESHASIVMSTNYDLDELEHILQPPCKLLGLLPRAWSYSLYWECRMLVVAAVRGGENPVERVGTIFPRDIIMADIENPKLWGWKRRTVRIR